MFTENAQGKPVEMFPDVVRRTLNSGAQTTLVELHMAKRSTVPLHTHPHEQIGYVVSGIVRFEIDGEKKDRNPGDSYLVPGGAPHGVEMLEDGVCVDIFYPVREEYL